MYSPDVGSLSPFRPPESTTDLPQHELDYIPFAKISDTVVKQQSVDAQAPQPTSWLTKIGGAEEDARVPSISRNPLNSVLQKESKRRLWSHTVTPWSQASGHTVELSPHIRHSNNRRRSLGSARSKGLNERYARMKTHMDTIVGSVPRFLPPRQDGYLRIPIQQQHHYHNHNPPRLHQQTHQHTPLANELPVVPELHAHAIGQHRLPYIVQPSPLGVTQQLFHQPPSQQQPSLFATPSQPAYLPTHQQMATPYEPTISEWSSRLKASAEQASLQHSSRPDQLYQPQFHPAPPTVPPCEPTIASQPVGVTTSIATCTPQLPSTVLTPPPFVHPNYLPTQPRRTPKKAPTQKQIVPSPAPSTADMRTQDQGHNIHATMAPPPPASSSAWTMQDQIRQLGQELRDSATSAIGLPRASREVTRAIIAQGLAARRYRIQQELQVRREHAMSPFAVATATAAAEATNHETTVPWPQGTGDDRKMHGQATTTCVIDELPLQPRHGDTRAAGSDEDEAWTHIDPWQLSLPFEHMPGDNRDDGDESKAINNGTLTPSHDIVDRSGGGDSTLCTTTCSTVVIDGVPPGSSPGTIQHHDDLYQEQLTSERTQQRISSSSVHRDPTETTAVAALDSVMDWPQQHIPAKANHRYPGRVLPEGIKRPQKQPQLIHDKQSTSATVFQSSVDHKTEEASEVTIFEIDDEDEHGLLGLVRSGGLLSGEMALLDNFDSFERELNECLSE